MTKTTVTNSAVVPGQFDDAPCDHNNTSNNKVGSVVNGSRNTTAPTEENEEKDGLRMLSIIASDNRDGDKAPQGNTNPAMTAHAVEEGDMVQLESKSNTSPSVTADGVVRGTSDSSSNNCTDAFLRNAVVNIYGDNTDIGAAGTLLNSNPASLRAQNGSCQINNNSSSAYRYLGGRGTSTMRAPPVPIASHSQVPHSSHGYPSHTAAHPGSVAAASHYAHPPHGYASYHYGAAHSAPSQVSQPPAVSLKVEEENTTSEHAPASISGPATTEIMPAAEHTSNSDGSIAPPTKVASTATSVEDQAPTTAPATTHAPAPMGYYHPHYMGMYGPPSHHPYPAHHPHTAHHPHAAAAHHHPHYAHYAAHPGAASYAPAPTSATSTHVTKPSSHPVQHLSAAPPANTATPPHVLHPQINPNLYFISTSNINENDVLCGRGGLTNQHLGNKKFRALVKQLQEKYITRKKHEKTLLSQAVVAVVRGSTPAGRFLKQDVQTGMWYDIGDEMATEKTSQAFREKVKVRADSKVLGVRKKSNDGPTEEKDDISKKLKNAAAEIIVQINDI